MSTRTRRWPGRTVHFISPPRWLTLIAAAGLSSAAPAQTLVQLPPVPGSQPSGQSILRDANALGHATGELVIVPPTGPGQVRAFTWSWRGGAIAAQGLPPNGRHAWATGINDDGEIVGRVQLDEPGNPEVAFHNGAILPRPPWIPVGGYNAVRINNAGTIIGTGGIYSDGSWTQLPDPGNNLRPDPTDINNRGEITANGFHLIRARYERPLVLVDGAWRDLGVPFGQHAWATGISDAGWVCGRGLPAGGNNSVGFRWNIHVPGPGDVLTPPPGFPGGRQMQVFAVNDKGDVVGSYDGADNRPHAVLWPAGATVGIALDQFIPPGSTFIRLESATAITEEGLIFGTGSVPFPPSAAVPRGFALLLPIFDTDGDGIPNCWEMAGIDVDGIAGPEIDLPAMGADPMRKDLFVEIDVMQGLSANPTALFAVRQAFAAAPVSNPDGSTGITLHTIVDDTTVPFESPSQTDPGEFPLNFAATRSSFFGTASDRANPRSARVLEARARVFRWCLAISIVSPASYAGCSELYGDDMVICTGPLFLNDGLDDNEERAATFMHEFGHCLGLDHGGADDIGLKPNYPSIMNYLFNYPMTRTFWRLDYSRAALAPLNESALNEFAGIGPATPEYASWTTMYGVTAANGARAVRFTSMTGAPVDFGSPDSFRLDGLFGTAMQDLNYIFEGDPLSPISPGEVLAAHNDWAAIRLPLGSGGKFAESQHNAHPNPLTIEAVERLRQLIAGDPPCPADFTGDGTIDSSDFFAFLALFFEADLGADVDGSGVIDSSDFFAFLAAFFDGCP